MSTGATGDPTPPVETTAGDPGQNVDEGESKGDDLPDHTPDAAVESPEPAGLRNRVVKAFRVLRGKDVRYQVIADPEQAARLQRRRQENRYRGVYAVVLLIAMGLQVAFADWFFYRYAQAVDFDLAPSVVIAFLSSVVVEVIGLVLVVTRSLFNQAPGPPD